MLLDNVVASSAAMTLAMDLMITHQDEVEGRGQALEESLLGSTFRQL